MEEQYSNQGEQELSYHRQREQRLDDKKIIELIKEGQETQIIARGGDVILLAGPTGSGKSTTTNYLLGDEMFVQRIQAQRLLKGHGYEDYEKEVIDSKGSFKIGHSKESHTANIQIARLRDQDFICDSPGFFDNRGPEMEIANATTLENFLKNCNSVRLVVLIGYPELVAQRGALFKEIYKLIKRILKYPERENFKKILFLFTKLPDNKTFKAISNEVQEMYESIQDDEEFDSQVMMNFLSVILDQVKENNTIVTPTDGKYQILLERILRQTPFRNPSQEFCFSVSEASIQKIELYVEETTNYITKLQDKGHFQQVMQTLFDFKQLRDYTSNNILREYYAIYESSISSDVMRKVEKVLSAFTEASVKSNIFSSQNIDEIKQIQSTLKTIDSYKKDVFESYDFSEEQFTKQIENVCQNIRKQITLDFPANIANVKINISKLKDFSDQTGLGVVTFQEVLKEINQIYSKEVQQFKGTSETFYLRDARFDENELRNKIQYFASKLGLIQQIDEFLSQFIACEGQDSFYAYISKFFSNKNRELLERIITITEQINKSIISSPSTSIDESHIGFNIHIDTLPNFEIILLRLLSENRVYAEYIVDTEVNYKKALKYLKEFNAQIFHFIKENSEGDFHSQLEHVLRKLDEIRKLDESIQNQTAEEYCQFKDDLRQKIKNKASEGKKLLISYSEEIEEFEGTQELLEEKLRITTLRQQQIKNFKKLKKIYEFLINIQWTDDYFQTKFTQSTINKLIKDLNNYFEQCRAKIQQLVNNERFNEIRFFITILNNLKALEEIITNFKDRYQLSIEVIKSKVMEKINYINNLVNDLAAETNFISNNRWKGLNESVIALKQIQTLEENFDGKSKDSFEKITNFMQKYYQENFEKIKNIKGMANCMSIINGMKGEENINLSKKQTEFVKHAQLISTNFNDLENVVGEDYSFDKLRELIKKTYENLEYDYLMKKQENGDLQEIQSSYMVLSDFVRQIDLDFLNEKFKILITPKEAITETFKRFSSSIKNGDFQSLPEHLDQLKNLSSEKDKQQLNAEFERLKNRFEQEIHNTSYTIKYISKKYIDKDLQDSLNSNLNIVAQIRQILLCYRKELFEQTSQFQLSRLLREITDDFLMKQKQQFFILIQKFDFKQMEQYYEQLLIFTKNFDRYNAIFNENEWSSYLKQVESVTEDIQQTILSLHSRKDSTLISLQQLVSALTEAEKQHSEFYQHYEQEKKLTIQEMQIMSKSFKASIQQKIIAQDTLGLNQARKQFQSFTSKIICMENTQLNELQFELESYRNEIEDLLDENSNQKYNEIGEFLAKKNDKEANKLLKNLKLVDEPSYAQIINKMKDIITTSFSQIQEGYPSIEPSHFQNLLSKALNHIKMRKHFEADEQKFVALSDQFINSIFNKSEKLFDECENILSQSDLFFSKEIFLSLLNQFQHFKIITEHLTQTPKLKELWQKLNDIFKKINNGLRILQEAQQQLLQEQMKAHNLKSLGRKFEPLLQIAKSDAHLFTECQILIEIKQVSEKLLIEEELLQNVKRIFNTSEKALEIALDNYDFQRVIQSIRNLKKSISISSEFQYSFIDLTSLCKKVESKVTTMTQEAKLIISKNITYDEKLNSLINRIYKADEDLRNLEEISIPPQMDILYYELNMKLDDEITNILNQCRANQEDLKVISKGIINIQRISENVSKFIPFVERKLLEVVEKIKKIIGEDIIFSLGNILKEDASGALVVNKISSFSSYNTEKFNELVGKHDINYIFSKLQLKEQGKKKGVISTDLKNKLNLLYNVYNSKYNEILDEYKYQREKWNEIIDQAQFLSKQITLPNSSWNDVSKTNVITMLALVCGYWTLTESGEQKSGKKNIFKKPNHTQILSVILLLGIQEEDGFVLCLKKFFSSNEKTQFQNKLIEILTGEGKSLTLGFSALTLALLGCDVDVVCYSNYLSERDEKDFRKLFNCFGVSEQIHYGTFKDQAERYLESQLNVRKATQDLIEGKNYNDSEQKSKSTTLKILLIDEVDIFFNQGYYGKTFNPVTSFKTPEVFNIIKDIWRQREQSSNAIKSSVMKSNDYNTLLSQYSQFKEYIDRQINQLCSDVRQVDKHYKTHKYEVRNNQIGYKQDDSSISTHISYGYHTLFAYFQQNSLGNIDSQYLESQICFSLNCGNISYALIPGTYAAILGVTGTLESLNNSMKDSLKKYNITCEIFTPSMFGASKLDFKEVDMTSVEIDQENQYVKIQEISASAVQNKQAVLIFFKDKQSLDAYHQSNYTVLSKERYIRVTEHRQPSDVDFEVQRATRAGQIGLFVREYGRGTDFICLDPNVKAAGGVIVIQTFLSDSKTEEIQIKGRTARQGQHGKYYLILNEKDLVSDFKLTSLQINQWRNNQNHTSLYKNLALYRDKMENSTFENINEKIKAAQDQHSASLQFYKDIRNKNIGKAKQYLNKNS